MLNMVSYGWVCFVVLCCVAVWRGMVVCQKRTMLVPLFGGTHNIIQHTWYLVHKQLALGTGTVQYVL